MALSSMKSMNSNQNMSRSFFSTRNNQTPELSISALTTISAPIKIQIGSKYKIFNFTKIVIF